MFQGMEYMYAVYEEKSFSKAAKRLFISQPSLSITVKRIEEKIGYPVFDRSSKPLKLTEFGKEYIRAVEKIRSLEDQFADYINDVDNLKTGHLVLGGSNLYSSWVLPSLMGDFSRKFPQIRLELKEETTAELTALLGSGKIDLMLDNCTLDEQVFERCLYEEEHLLLAVPESFSVNGDLEKYRLTAAQVRERKFLEPDVEPVSLTYFEGLPFIMMKSENDTGQRAALMLKESGITPQVAFELDQQMTSFNVTCSGMGVSFISDTLIRRIPFEGNVAYYRLPGEHGVRKSYFYWKRGRYFTRAMAEFLKISGRI